MESSGVGGYCAKIQKNGNLYFPPEVMRVYELDKKYFKFFIDVEKKTIGWQVLEGSTKMEDLNDARQMNMNVDNKCGIFGIGKLLKRLGWQVGQAYEYIQVKKYEAPLYAHEIWYITLEDSYLIKKEQ